MLLSKKLAFCAMMTALAVLCLALTNVLTTTTAFLCLFSTLFIMLSVLECGYKFGFLTYAAVCALGYMLAADKLMMAGYIAAVGYYPLLKRWIERRAWPIWGRRAVKLLCFVIVLAALWFLAGVLFELHLPVWLAPLGLALCLLYDWCLSAGVRFYALHIRRHIVP